MNNLSLNIKRVREFKNFTQQHVANSLKMSQSSYSDIENGKHR